MSTEIDPPRWPLPIARKYAEHVQRELAGLCERIDIAGSVRRERERCGDIDLVLLLKPGKRGELEQRVRRSANTKVLRSGPQILAFILYNGIQVDLFFATPVEDTLMGRIPSNYGMRLLAMTGSKAHNIKLASLARDRGYHFHPYKGLMQGGKYVSRDGGGEEYEGGEVRCSETEEEIFATLGESFVRPQDRETEAYFSKLAGARP